MSKWTYNRVYQALTTQPILIRSLTRDEIEVMRQAEAMRKEFGDRGVEMYFEAMEKKLTAESIREATTQESAQGRDGEGKHDAR